MNTYHLLIIEDVLKNAVTQLSMLSRTEYAINYDRRSDILLNLQTVYDLYSSFFINAGFLDDNTNYCSNEFAEIVNLNDETDNHALNMISQFIKSSILPPPRDLYFSILPIHIRVSLDDSFVLLTGIAGKEMSRDTATIICKEVTVKKSRLEEIPLGLEYLNGVIKSYDPQRYESIRVFAQENNLQYKRLQQDCQTCFNNSFYQMYLKMRLTGSLSAILFSSEPLKQIAADNDFANYNRMYEAFGKVGIVPSELPRFHPFVS